jgi:cell division septum initiation protein DivIVA
MEYSRLAQENRELKEELARINASIAEEREAHDLIRRAFNLLAEARKVDAK